MAANVSQLGPATNSRISSLIAPREHGAWGLLLVPLATGAAVGLFAGGSALPLVTFTVAALALFWLRTPVESWLGTRLLRVQTQQERRAVGITILILAAVAAFALASLFRAGRNQRLLPLGAIALSAFVAQDLLRKRGRQTRMLAQVVGTIGLTVTAPAAYYLVTARLNGEALTLWMLNLLFATNQIHFVQLRIHSARISDWTQKFHFGRRFLFGEVLLASALILAWRLQLLPGLAALAFSPILIRGTVSLLERQKPLAVRRLGWTELAHAVVFAAWLTAGFYLGH
jgi:hypothetical protein